MKLLIIHTAYIGDIILSTPFIESLYANDKSAEIYYVTTKLGAQVLANNPYIKEVIVYDKRGEHKGLKGFLRMSERLKKYHFDRAYIFHRYLRSVALAKFAKIPERIGYDVSGGSWMLTQKVPYIKGVHEVERLLRFEDFKERKTPIKLYGCFTLEQGVDQLFMKNHVDDRKPLIALAPGSKWFTKQWPMEYVSALLELLSKKEVQVLLIGGKEESLLDISKNHENVIDLMGHTSLLEVYEIFRRCDVVVSNDSSPIHFASATKAKVIAIFGATVKELGFYPWSENSIVLEDLDVECRPCGLHGGESCPKGHFECMRNITPERVLLEIEKALSEVQDEKNSSHKV